MIEGTDRDRLLELVAYLEVTEDDEWLTGHVRSKEDGRNCCMGHVFAMGGKNEKIGNQWWWFEEVVATTYMIFPVNDGEDERYPQATPKVRVVAYLQDVLAGVRKTTYELYDA